MVAGAPASDDGHHPAADLEPAMLLITLSTLFRRPVARRAAARAAGPAAARATVGAAAAAAAGADEGAEPGPPDELSVASACGWFDSSRALREGLAVSELAAGDWPVAALWFGSAAFSGPLAAA